MAIYVLFTGAASLIRMLDYNAKIFIPLYTALLTAILLGWLLELNYWLYQNETDGDCPFWFDEDDAAWWGISFSAIIFQILYFLYLDQNYGFIVNWRYPLLCCLALSLLTQLMCTSNIYLNVSTPMFYWLSKLPLIGIIRLVQLNLYDKYSELDEDDLEQPILYKRFHIDLCVMFIIVHYSVCALVDILSLNPIFSVFYITNFVGHWCTSVIIVVGLFESFEFLLNVLFSASRFKVTGEKALEAEVCCVDFGARASIVMPLFYIVADIPLNDVTLLKYELFLFCYISLKIAVGVNKELFSFCYISLKVAVGMNKELCCEVHSSREAYTYLACLRVSVFTAIVTIIPTVLTVILSAYMQINVCYLLIVNENTVLIWRACCTFLEVLITVFAPNSTKCDIERRDDTLYRVRRVKNLVMARASPVTWVFRICFLASLGDNYLVNLIIASCDIGTMFKWSAYCSKINT